MSLATLLKSFDNEKKVEAIEAVKLVEKDKDGISLKGVLQKHRAKLLRERPLSKQGITFSPSQLTYSYCRRAKVAQLAGKVDLFYERTKPALQTVFDMGNMLHEMLQGYFWDIGLLKGSFECMLCDQAFDNLVSPKRCPNGHSRRFMRYREIKLKNDKYMLYGRCDGILLIEDVEHIMDIKSISNKGMSAGPNEVCFEDLDREGPKYDHIVQLTLYMFMSGIKRGHLLYISKNKGRIKSFAVPYDKKIIDPYLKEIQQLQELAKKMKNGKLLPKELPAPCGRATCNCEQILSKV